MKVAAQREDAHRATIRCLDFASGNGSYLASCGDDCRVKVWDIRWVPL